MYILVIFFSVHVREWWVDLEPTPPASEIRVKNTLSEVIYDIMVIILFFFKMVNYTTHVQMPQKLYMQVG